jgi:hypothetical protein
MTEWPSERRARQDQQMRGVPSAYGMLDFSGIDEATRYKARELAGHIAAAYRDRAKPEATVGSLEEWLRTAEASGSALAPEQSAALAVACVEALKQTPTADLWEYLWSLAWHSAPLAHSLPQAVIAAVNADASFMKAFARIAGEVVQNAVANPGRRSIAREKGLARHLHEDWKEHPALSRLWWGHLERGATFLQRDDDGIFGIMGSFDARAFAALLGMLDNPFTVLAALNASGACWRFDRWRELTAIAPPAFDPDGSWNGSAALPLLLYLGRTQLQPEMGRDISDADLKQAAEEIDGLIQDISTLLAARDDAAGCAQRWATWLMRGAMTGLSREATPFPADVRSRGYVDTALIDALAKRLPPDGWSPSPPPDAEVWEPWCYHSVRISVANALGKSMPPIDDFIAEWRVSPDEWTSLPGRLLRAHASVFETLGKRADAYGTRVLALPLVEVPDASGVWRQLWAATTTIREVVEFGDTDAAQDNEWRARSEAAQLMRLVFGLGLMMMDHIIMPIRPLAYDRRPVLEELLSSLAEAVNEMASIDHADQGFWGDAMRHLAIRRAVWFSGRQPQASPAAGVSFDEKTWPRLEDFIRWLRGDVQALIGFVEVALRNRVDPATLEQALDAAGVDLKKESALAERLIALDPKRAGITTEQLAAAATLLN